MRGIDKSPTNGFTGPPALALWRVTGEASPEVIAGLIRGISQPIQRYQLMSLEDCLEIGPAASNAVPALRPLLKARHRAIQKAAEALRSVEWPPGLTSGPQEWARPNSIVMYGALPALKSMIPHGWQQGKPLRPPDAGVRRSVYWFSEFHEDNTFTPSPGNGSGAAGELPGGRNWRRLP